ncbi:MAG: hypothetical protein U0271_27090 [Polyangiaceae bacterium]
MLGVVGMLLAGATGCKRSSSGEASSPAEVESGAGDTQGSSGSTSKQATATKAVGTPSGPTVANYPAFEVLDDGRSVITIQVRGLADITEQKAEGRIIYSLAGVEVSDRVNRLPLLTQHFPTQVTSVVLEPTTGGANLIIDLREPSSATFSVVKNEAGSLVTITLPRSEKYGSTKNPDNDPTNWERPSNVPESDVADDQNTTAEGWDEERQRRIRKSRRQAKGYVERPLTLPHAVIAPDIAISAAGAEGAGPFVFLSSGIRWGIIDQVEVEFTPHEFRLAPNPAWAYPSLGITAGYTGHTFEIGGRLRYFIGLDSDTWDPNGGAMLVGVPMAIHLSNWGRIETGAFLTLDFSGVGGGSPFLRDSANGDVVVGLSDLNASPFFLDSGIPFRFLFQPLPELWFGIHNGIAIYDFSDAAETFAIPLGGEIGINASGLYNPIADLGVRVDFPRLFMPAASDPVQERTYEIGVWFRWYHHL